ncbi:hypothetical protein BGX27_004205 [Mortierella sp. AM989]|nr:hypothetical protein BGX27_004205 [Mortierella sp. AM989]
MATPRRVLSKGTSILKQAHLEQKCATSVLARYKHTTGGTRSTVQGNSAIRSEPTRSHHSFGCIEPSTAKSFPLLSVPGHYTQLPTTSSLQSIIFKRSIVTNHHFNTNKIVSCLEKNGYQRGQAEGIMRTIKALIGQHTTRIRKNMLTKGDLENESYLFKAALTELRTELQILRKNDAAALTNSQEIISREIDSLNQKLREDIANVKNDIAIDMNSRKSDVREEQKQLEIRIQSMSNHYMAQLGDMRTKMEAAKWEATRKGMMLIFVSATFVLLASRMFMSSKDEKVPDDYIDPYVNHANAQNNGDGMVPDSFVVSHRS